MNYLKAAVELKDLIKETNSTFLEKKDQIRINPNLMRVALEERDFQNFVMDSFSNEFVSKTLEKMEHSKAFVFTDIAQMNVEGKELTYLLYKGYHSIIEKGLVFYQPVDKKTLEPQGPLRFSNLEDNIFYEIITPSIEESNCNAMETDQVIEHGKSIVFFIGHINQQRLAYDIERLIFDTVNNVSKHPQLTFKFIVQISVYEGNISKEFIEKVKAIDRYTQKHIYPEYPNAHFEFIFEQEEESL